MDKVNKILLVSGTFIFPFVSGQAQKQKFEKKAPNRFYNGR